jgi:hypothetical protein
MELIDFNGGIDETQYGEVLLWDLYEKSKKSKKKGGGE